MKITITKTLALAAVLGMGAAHAAERKTMRAEIPFAFRAGDTQLPAGEYTVWQNPGNGYVAIASAAGTARAALFANPGYPAQHNQATLVFHRYGDTYFLAEIRGEQTVRLGKSAAEREMADAGAPVALALLRVVAQ